MKSCLVGGEIGDAIYALPTIRDSGNESVFVTNRSFVRPDWVNRSKSVERLFLSQPYVSSFKEERRHTISLDLTDYRSGGHPFGRTIAYKIARWARVDVDLTRPWLSVEKNLVTSGKIVVNHSPRWRGWWFPWRSIVEQLGKHMVYVGLPSEHKEFCESFGKVEYLPCKDMLDVAQAIAGSSLFIGNQSSPFACCEGLKRPSVLSVCGYACDCFYGRENCVYYMSGDLSFKFQGSLYEFPQGPILRAVEAPRMTVGEMRELAMRVDFLLQGKPIPSLVEIRSQLSLVK